MLDDIKNRNAEMLTQMTLHWNTEEGAAMSEKYMGMDRSQLANGFVTDMTAANEIFMADRGALNLIAYQTMAKERIRWLSAQLAKSINEMTVVLEHLEATEERANYCRPEVQAFARKMEDAFRAKDGQYGGNSWQKNTMPEEILPHLMERSFRISDYIEEAEDARREKNDIGQSIALDGASTECINAANFALMIVDIAKNLDYDRPEVAVETT